jgi:hypothetical protein
MSEDYLWDKSGKDTEIERLEDVLIAFRYRETAAPELPAKMISLKKNAPRWTFKLSFAFAAFAVLAIVFAGIRLQFPDDTIEVAAIDLETIAPPTVEKLSVQPSFEKPRYSIIKARAIPKKTVAFKPLKIKKSLTTVENRNYLTAVNSKIKKPTVKLTTDEKYAYDQLMLALSITSSKLRLVTDKIDAIEKQTVVRENER